ncbi:MAG: FAD-binding protein [Deltaproteobacteria bacterium]|nr:FAD-binding protein [Deltaproteobacteria bacterium]
MFDIAIIGAGPAGATLARLIGEKYKVLLVDKRQLSDTPEGFSSGKCCGGLLAPDAQRMLSKLGLGLPKRVLEEPQLFVVRAIDLQQGLEGYYQRHYINMNRWEFDRWLLSIVPPGVEKRLGFQFRSYTSEDTCFHIKLSKDNRTYSEKTKILVGADGAFSRVRARAFPGHPFPERYFAIQEWVHTYSNLPYFSSFFDPEITDYYCWTIPKEDNMIIGAALRPRENTAEKFKTLKRKLRDHGFDFGKTVWREGAHILRPSRLQQLFTGTKGVALIGEAAGWISPSSAEGISYAFRSALLLAESLKTGIRDFEKRYYQGAGILRRNIFLKNVKSRFIFNPRLRKAVMRSGLQSMKIYKP